MGKKGKLSDPPRKEDKTRKIDKNNLIILVETEPDGALGGYAQHFNCCPQAIASGFKKLEITRKKTLLYQERDEDQRQKYQSELQKLSVNKRVYVDESGIEETIL